jgi:hypothetical protein
MFEGGGVRVKDLFDIPELFSARAEGGSFIGGDEDLLRYPRVTAAARRAASSQLAQ